MNRRKTDGPSHPSFILDPIWQLMNQLTVRSADNGDKKKIPAQTSRDPIKTQIKRTVIYNLKYALRCHFSKQCRSSVTGGTRKCTRITDEYFTRNVRETDDFFCPETIVWESHASSKHRT